MDKTMDTASDLEPSSRLENQRFVRFGPTFLKTIALSYFFFTIFYGFVKKMVQKNQYTYNVPPGSSAPASINEARRAELRILLWILLIFMDL